MPTQQVLGGSSEASIDQVNIWMRSTPWYQNQMRAWGQDPGHPTLTEWQSQQIKRLAQANGVVVDEGNVELDDHGNFNPIGHKLRNTLIVGGLAAATIATMGAAGVFAGAGGAAGGGAAVGSAGAAGTAGTLAGVEGGAYGLGSGALAGLGSGAMGAAGVGGAGLAGLETAGELGTNFMGGPTTISSIVGGVGGASHGLSYADLLKFGLPTIGGIANGLIQAHAEGQASDAQQRYLEEALAAAKEKDLYQRGIDKEAVAREEGRYNNFQGRIKGFIDNGQSSNDRMTALLGLPARAPGSASSGGGARGGDLGDPISYADKLSAADKLKVDALLKASNSNDNPRYWYGVNAQHGGFDATGADWNHTRISTGDGAGKGYTAPTTAAPTPPASAPPITTQPQARTTTVQMRAPDGSIKTVPTDQVEHYTALGATLLGAAA